MADDKLQRIVEARMKLKARFEQKIRGTPSLADPRPMGTGASDRHGMPKLPVGQSESRKWPVLDLGISPTVDRSNFRLVVDGAAERPFELDFAELLALPQIEDVSDFHCVTAWSRMDLRWVGVRLHGVLALAEPKSSAAHLMCHGSDGYSTNPAL
jgi:DMSO/TMAO reductase YedYZ molybdopterin-dependent catalytic subunit